ncbi:hypothetical protein [Mesorhizobium mediterraneum]|nr:hypothetical protein [Mesorhizobium mediterraneum]
MSKSWPHMGHSKKCSASSLIGRSDLCPCIQWLRRNGDDDAILGDPPSRRGRYHHLVTNANSPRHAEDLERKRHRQALANIDEPASSNRWMKPIWAGASLMHGATYPCAWQGQGQEARWLYGLNMSKTTLIAIAIAISVGYAEAADRKVETAPLGTYANSKNLPVCTASSSLFEVLGDKCFLVKGSMIYGDIAELSQIITLGR